MDTKRREKLLAVLNRDTERESAGVGLSGDDLFLSARDIFAIVSGATPTKVRGPSINFPNQATLAAHVPRQAFPFCFICLILLFPLFTIFCFR
jgi:hypothetical protein